MFRELQTAFLPVSFDVRDVRKRVLWMSNKMRWGDQTYMAAMIEAKTNTINTMGRNRTYDLPTLEREFEELRWASLGA